MRHYATLVSEKIKADATLQTNKPQKVSAGFLYWNVLNGILKPIAKALSIYGLEPVPILQGKERHYVSQFADMYDAMKSREGTTVQPNDEEKRLYRLVFDNTRLQLKTWAKDNPEIRNVTNAALRRSGMEDPVKNLGNNRLTSKAIMGTWGITFLVWAANMCKKHITYKEDEADATEQARLTKYTYKALTSGSTVTRLDKISFNDISTGWNLSHFEMPDNQKPGFPTSFMEWAMFLFGDGVRLSLQDNPDVITHKDNAKYWRATVNTINETLGSNKWTMNLEQTNIEEAASEATSPGKKRRR